MEWHRLLGLTLYNLFLDTPWEVELEKDLSLKKQLLDIVIIRRREGGFSGRLPDGLEDLVDHNLLTYKSLREAMDDWALKELTGHYVNYRKQISPSMQELLPEADFRMFAISTRFPRGLTADLPLQPMGHPGIYEVTRGTDRIRVVVLSEVEQAEHNTVWQLFSGVPEGVQYGAAHYHPRTKEESTLLNQLFHAYNLEGLDMPYTWQDFLLDVTKENVGLLPTEDRLKGLSTEDLLKRLSRDQIESYLKQVDEETKHDESSEDA